MRVILFGATGMVGHGVLLEALDDPEVTEVLAVGRSPVPVRHAKLTEAQHADFTDFSALRERFAGFDACFFCLGVSSAGMSEADYARVTFDYAVAAARAVPKSAVFVYVSGAGTDSTEKGRSMWARVKGRTENAILGMGFRAAYMFRPGFIRPERGVTSRTSWYRAVYVMTKPFARLLSRGSMGTTTRRVGQAMLLVARATPPGAFVDTKRINELAAQYSSEP